MALTREEHELVMKVVNAEKVAQLNALLEAEEQTLLELYQAYDRGAVPAANFERVARNLTGSIAANQKAMEQLTASAKGFTLAGANMTQIVQQGGYMLGDLGQTSGDLGMKLSAVTNNIQFMTAGLGPWGVAVGVAAVGAVSLYRNWDTVVKLFETTTPFRRQADDLDYMRQQAKKVKDELAELEAQGELTDKQHDRRNHLLKQQADLEERITREQREQAELRRLQGIGDKEHEERGRAFEQAVGQAGGFELVSNQLYQALENIAVATGQQGVTPESIRRQVEELMRNAQRGIKEDRDTIQRAIMRGMPEGQRKFGRAIRDTSPEAKEAGEQSERDLAAIQKEADAEFEANRLVDTLNEQGRENERVMREGQRREAEQGRKVAGQRAEQNAAEQRKRHAAQIGAAEKAFGETPLGEFAAVRAAQLQAGGADESQRLIQLAPELARMIRPSPMSRGLSDDAVRELATRMALKADEDAGALTRSNEAVAGMGQAALGRDAAAQQAVAASLTAVQMLTQRLNAAEQQWAALGRQFGGLAADGAVRQPFNLRNFR